MTKTMDETLRDGGSTTLREDVDTQQALNAKEKPYLPPPDEPDEPDEPPDGPDEPPMNQTKHQLPRTFSEDRRPDDCISP